MNTLAQPQSAPNAQLRTALLRGRRRPRNFGAGAPSIFRGDGYEFVQLRQYVAGDDTRRIDWAATARAGSLQTRVVLEDVALTLAAIVDDSRSMHVGRNRPLAASADEAMSAWYHAAAADDRCVRITSQGYFSPTGLRGAHSALVCAHAPGTSQPLDLLRALHVARAALPRGAALLLISDFFDIFTGVAPRQGDPKDTVAVLADLGSRFDCTALFARDPWFEELPLHGFVRLRDAETGAQRQMFIGHRARERHRAAGAAREEEALLALARAGWRTGVLHEEDGTHGLLASFGLR